MTDDKPDPQPEPAATFTRETDTPETLEQAFDAPEVKAITPTRELPAPSERQAAAVHDGELWNGPRWIRDAEGEPVFCRTKAEYWELLKRNGLHMRDQQESVVPGPELPPRTPVLEVHLTPHPDVPPMTKHEAEVFGAVTAVFKRYGIIESLWCTHCFARNMAHGCRMKVNARGVALQCRGGYAAWSVPVGERNVLLQTLANTTSSRLIDSAPGTVLTPSGPVFKPARILVTEEVMILREYFKALARRGIDPRWHHRECWSGNPWLESDALAVHVDDESIIAVCACRQLYARSSRPTPPMVH